MRVYELWHGSAETTDGYPSRIDQKGIGVFSSLELAYQVKNRYLQVTGFKDFPAGFHIEVIDIQEDMDSIDSVHASGDTYYRIWFCNDGVEDEGPIVINEDSIEVSLGLFFNRNDAERACEEYKKKEPFCKAPQFLKVYDGVLNMEGWTEGFDRYTYRIKRETIFTVLYNKIRNIWTWK